MQILELVIRLKCQYRTAVLHRVGGFGKLLIFLTGLWFLSALIIFNASRNNGAPILEVLSGIISCKLDCVLLVMILVAQLLINYKILLLAVIECNQDKEELAESTRILNSLIIWNKAKYSRFGFCFQYINSGSRCSVRLLHSTAFKRKARAMMTEEQFASQLREEIEENFKLAAAKGQKAKVNLKLKELSLSSEQKMSLEGQRSIEGRIAQNSSVQEASREQLNISGAEGSKDFNRNWIENSDSKISMHMVPRGNKIEENLLIEEYGYEEEHSDYQMGKEEEDVDDEDDDDYLEQEYERAVSTSKKHQNKESHQSIQLRSITKKESLDVPSKKDLSFNEMSSGSMNEEQKVKNRFNDPIQASSLDNARKNDLPLAVNEQPAGKLLIGDKSKQPIVKISKRIAKTHDEDFDEMEQNLPPVKVKFSKKPLNQNQ